MCYVLGGRQLAEFEKRETRHRQEIGRLRERIEQSSARHAAELDRVHEEHGAELQRLYEDLDAAPSPPRDAIHPVVGASPAQQLEVGSVLPLIDSVSFAV